MNRGAKIGSWVAVAVVLTGAGLFGRWNTDVFGQETFCHDAVSSTAVGAALNQQGRLTTRTEYESKDPYGFRCTVQRTSKFIGGAQPSVDIDLTADSATAPFQSRLWKTPSTMSYTKGDMAGGASKTRAWLLLPAECWDKVPSRKGTVPLLSLELNNGEAAERQLMDLAVSTAEHIAQTAGCPIPDETGTVALTEPGGSQLPRPTDPDNVCGLKGFTLPSNAVIPSRAEPGTERSTTTGAQTWACDLYLKGPGKPQISLALSRNLTVVAGVQRDIGTGSGERKVLNCQAGGMYVTVNPNEAYDDALLDEYEYAKGDKIGETRTQLLSSFATAAAAEHGCTAP